MLTYYGINGNIKYEGEIKDNNANGYGIMYYDNRVKQYEGEWKNGKANGFGILYGENGEKICEGLYSEDEWGIRLIF